MLLLTIVAVVLVTYLAIKIFGKIAKRDKDSLIPVRSASSGEEESASHQTKNVA